MFTASTKSILASSATLRTGRVLALQAEEAGQTPWRANYKPSVFGLSKIFLALNRLHEWTDENEKDTR
jgi:hypothetical protein